MHQINLTALLSHKSKELLACEHFQERGVGIPKHPFISVTQRGTKRTQLAMLMTIKHKSLCVGIGLKKELRSMLLPLSETKCQTPERDV